MDCSSCSGEGGLVRSGMPPGRLSRPERREDSPSVGGGVSSDAPPRRVVDIL